MSFKGDKKKKKKKKKVKHELQASKEKEASLAVEDLTDADKKALKRKEERDKEELRKVASKSHRDRVEEFNEKLGNLTEHNDIPRVRIVNETLEVDIVVVIFLIYLLFDYPTGQCCRKRLIRPRAHIKVKGLSQSREYRIVSN